MDFLSPDKSNCHLVPQQTLSRDTAKDYGPSLPAACPKGNQKNPQIICGGPASFADKLYRRVVRLGETFHPKEQTRICEGKPSTAWYKLLMLLFFILSCLFIHIPNLHL